MAENELERERLRLAACGVAAMSNTEDGRAKRIGKDNPCWSASYGDVCAAVDREMELRERVAAREAVIARLVEAMEEIRSRTQPPPVKKWESIQGILDVAYKISKEALAAAKAPSKI